MDVRQLSAWPNERALLVKAALSAVPRTRGADEAPEVELRYDGVAVDRARLAAYDRVCGFRLTDTLPATYPHVLSFPPAMRLMTDPAFPFALPGIVHVGNRITQHRPIRSDELLNLAVRAENVRPHRAGSQVDVVVEARVGDELVWRGVSTHLSRSRRSRTSSDGADGTGGADGEPESEATRVAVWSVPGDTGRRYATVSGDRNPIHTSRVGARLFGFKRPIAHGMWTAARALAALEGRLPPAYQYDVEFKRPLLLPGRAVLALAEEDGSAIRLEVRSARSGKPHLRGRLGHDGS